MKFNCILFALFTSFAANAVSSLKIDNKIWTRSDKIEWPSNENSVLTYVSREDIIYNSDCEALTVAAESFYANQNNDTFFFGIFCNRPVVGLDFSKSKLKNKQQIKYLLAHESFHLVVQGLGMKRPINRLDYDTPKSKDNVYKLFKMLMENSQHNKHSCQQYETFYNKLSESERSFIAFTAFSEWPAEFYSYHSAAFDIDEYLRFTNTSSKKAKFISKSEKSRFDKNKARYQSAVLIITELEQRVSRQAWQKKLAEQGMSPLKQFFDAIGCDISEDIHPLFVKVIPEDLIQGID